MRSRHPHDYPPALRDVGGRFREAIDSAHGHTVYEPHNDGWLCRVPGAGDLLPEKRTDCSAERGRFDG